MEEFDIEKAESLNYDKLKNQLQYIFKTEQDCVNFVNFLKNVNNFVSLSNDKRHITQIDLGYFKAQLTLFEKKIKIVLDKKKSARTKAAIKKAKGIGEKLTESIIDYYTEEDNAIQGLEELLALVSAWVGFLQDLYFICGQTSKNLGGIS